MLIAIDHGNYAIKTPHHSFVSGLSEHTVKPPMSDEILEYDGRYWTTSGKRLSYMRDKTQDDRYFVLTLFAIAKELEDTGRYSPVEQIQLAVACRRSITVYSRTNSPGISNGTALSNLFIRISRTAL